MSSLVHGSIDMDAMERKFFTTNLATEDSNDDLRENDSGEEEDHGDPDHGIGYDPEVEAVAAAAPHTDKSMLRQHRPEGGNTGPKGVKADYNEWQKHKEEERSRAEAEREALLLRLVSGATSSTPSVSYSAMEAQQALEKAVRQVHAHQGGGGEDDEQAEEDLLDELEDDEDAFMEAYRQKRRTEMELHSKLPTYGKVTSLDAFAFLDRIENADPKVHVIVHMYEDDVRACRALNITLESLAREHKHTDFVCLRKSDTPTGLPCSSLPSLLIYRAGELVETAMAIADQVGATCPKHAVEELLTEKGCFRNR
jgi:hypothetical protein